MPQDANNTALKLQQFDPDEVSLMFSDPFRRAVIRALAGGEMKVAADLGWAKGIRRHNKLKHLAALCEAGILVQKENPNDARAPLFELSPKVIVRKDGTSLIVDFGRWQLRFG